ncbi:MAG TPA: urease accessory protein UreD [Stellaceae bacterium]|jgi:urease accessory protein|nr:urease accessory protein UreD [Stellaceae bacterium]
MAPRHDHLESFTRNRTRGVAEIGFARRGGATRLAHLYQRDPLRVLFPGPDGDPAALAVIVTTSGGLVAGDRLGISVEIGAGAVAHVTGSAAEKLYRSTGATTEIRQRLSVEAGGWLEFLPPEAILFDGTRLRRETHVELANGGGFLGGGIIVFGRRARGEGFTHGLLHEVWEIRRDGALVWGDALHVDCDVAAIMRDPACFAGASACATLILAPPSGDPTLYIDAARAAQQRAPELRAGVTAVGGLVIARWLGDPPALRRAYADLACHLRAAAMGLPPRLPRLWHV